MASIVGRVRALTSRASHPTLAVLLRQLNPVLRGWTAYFQHAVAKATFGHLRHYTWNRVIRWLRHKHRKSSWKALRRRYGPTGWWPRDGEMTLFDPASVTVTRYRYRGVIPSRWAALAQLA